MKFTKERTAFLAGCWGTVYRSKYKNGDSKYVYIGDNVSFCKERPGEKCTICGKCMPQIPSMEE